MGGTTDLRTETRRLIKDLRTHLEFFQIMGIEGLPPGPGRVARPDEAGPIAAAQPSASGPKLSPTEAMMTGLLFEEALFPDSGSKTPVVRTERPADRTLEEIRADIGDCQRCKLCETRTTIVFGEGNPRADLLFIGEAPGADEDEQGRPFVGRAGQLLTRMIEAMGLKRDEVYICNLIKCRPPGNDFSLAIRVGAVAACEGFVHRQISVIAPKVMVALGNPAVQSLLKTKEGITRLRGNWQAYHGIPVMPTYHPAFLLRWPDKKRETWEDLQKVMALLEIGPKNPEIGGVHKR